MTWSVGAETRVRPGSDFRARRRAHLQHSKSEPSPDILSLRASRERRSGLPDKGSDRRHAPPRAAQAQCRCGHASATRRRRTVRSPARRTSRRRRTAREPARLLLRRLRRPRTYGVRSAEGDQRGYRSARSRIRRAIRPGDVQRMSVGTGIRHRKDDASAMEPVHSLRIWIIPGYGHCCFPCSTRRISTRAFRARTR
jgi:hypothetical protein